jgi:ATP-dependent Clp protease, protease subunit
MVKKNNGELFKNNFLPGYAESYIKLAKDRKIFLNEEIDKENASDLAAWLLYYDHLDPEDPITIYIHSPGGQTAGLIHIYDVMQFIKAPIRTICMGRAASAAAVILAAGTKGERYACRNSEIMIHGVQGVFPIPGMDIKNNKNFFDFFKNHNDDVMKMLARHTGKPLTQVREDCSEDYYMTAQAAKKYGIIDEII